MEWGSEIFSDLFPNSCAQREHIFLYLRHLTVIVHVARIGSPFGLFATHTGCVDVVEYVSLNSKTRLPRCSHLSGATAADTVIPTFPAAVAFWCFTIPCSKYLYISHSRILRLQLPFTFPTKSPLATFHCRRGAI